jgi:uncharacterized protein (TIGR03118 family)
MKRLHLITLSLCALLFVIAPASAQKHHQDYTRVNLVSDIDGVARFTDPHLVNPWGLAFSATSPFWIADNNGNVSTLYNGRGQAFPVGSPLVVNIPAPGAPTGGTPTGLVFNGTGEFSITANGKSGSAIFLFSSEDGTILGWTPAVDAANAVIAVPPVNGAVYKGLAIASTSKGNFIYATNFNSGWVEMYDKDFKLVKTFTDPNVDANFAPFGIQNINGKLYVTFAKQKLPDKHDDDAGPGNGYVDVFDTDGTMIRRFASHGPLNSPWGLALAPERFGEFGGHLLVGNFGDGRINAFDLHSGEFDSPLIDPQGNPLAINGLWALQFGAGGANNGKRNHLFFTAGIADEAHGLFGFIRPGRNDDDDDENRD